LCGNSSIHHVRSEHLIFTQQTSTQSMSTHSLWLAALPAADGEQSLPLQGSDSAFPPSRPSGLSAEAYCTSVDQAVPVQGTERRLTFRGAACCRGRRRASRRRADRAGTAK